MAANFRSINMVKIFRLPSGVWRLTGFEAQNHNKSKLFLDFVCLFFMVFFQVQRLLNGFLSPVVQID